MASHNLGNILIGVNPGNVLASFRWTWPSERRRGSRSGPSPLQIEDTERGQRLVAGSLGVVSGSSGAGIFSSEVSSTYFAA